MSRIIVHVKYFTEVKSWQDLDITFAFRDKKRVDAVMIRTDRCHTVVGLGRRCRRERLPR